MEERKRKPIPEFASEVEERAFWESPENDSAEYVDWSTAKAVAFPNLKRSETETPHPSPEAKDEE